MKSVIQTVLAALVHVVTAAAGGGRFLLLRDQYLGRQDQTRDGTSVLKCAAHYFRRIYDSHRNEITVLAGRRI